VTLKDVFKGKHHEGNEGSMNIQTANAMQMLLPMFLFKTNPSYSSERRCCAQVTSFCLQTLAGMMMMRDKCGTEVGREISKLFRGTQTPPSNEENRREAPDGNYQS